jgi:hypothetical protein
VAVVSAAIVGFAVGWYACYLFTCWGAAYRACCRDHYKTHPKCACADCERDRRLA